MNRMNSMEFTPHEVESGQLEKFLKMLLELEYEHSYNDIHIWNDGYCTIIEWETVPYNNAYGGKFQYVDSDHEVVSIYNEEED